jgi:hypothetical protein
MKLWTVTVMMTSKKWRRGGEEKTRKMESGGDEKPMKEERE